MLRFILIAVWIFILVLATSIFVTTIIQNEMILWGVPFLPVIPILGLMWLRPKEELAGWATFTVWLGSTYAHLGHTHEFFVFALIIGCALLGYFRSPWFIIPAWFGHAIWDLFPRELPPLYDNFPIGCLIFDSLIGAFIIWRIIAGRWKEKNQDPQIFKQPSTG